MYYGIIGGTGFEAPFQDAEEKLMHTPYGDAKIFSQKTNPTYSSPVTEPIIPFHPIKYLTAPIFGH